MRHVIDHHQRTEVEERGKKRRVRQTLVGGQGRKMSALVQQPMQPGVRKPE